MIFWHRFLPVCIVVALNPIPAKAEVQNAQTQWALPDPPKSDELERAFPSCDDLSASSKARTCMINLEFYRSQTLETNYNLGDLRLYIRNLKRLSASLENAHASNSIGLAQYQQIHDSISDALDDATATDGKYPTTYRNYYNRYKSADGAAIQAYKSDVLRGQ